MRAHTVRSDEDGHEETDDSGQAYIGEFGVILHTAPKNGVCTGARIGHG